MATSKERKIGSENTSQTITTQRTSKPLKAQLFLSAWLFWFALVSWFLPYGGAYGESEGWSWSATAIMIGGVWYFITKILIWWNHK